jgi:short-subunit dehydrogenase
MGGLLTTDVREHQMIHTLNTTALLRLSYAALAAFSPRGQGTLINIASILALHALPGSAVYSASKAWVLSFTRALQEEFADSGLRIQAVLPAATATDLWPTSGVALDALPAGSVTTEDLVDAALSGLDQGENHPAAGPRSGALESFRPGATRAVWQRAQRPTGAALSPG